MGLLKDYYKLRGEGEWGWTDGSVLTVTMEVDNKAASAWLPNWLRMLEPARATVFVADYPNGVSVGVDPYHETAVLLHVRLGRAEGVFSPWMLVDDGTAMLLGRELIGSPKKMGEISLSVGDDQVKADVERKGTKLLTITGKLGDIDPVPPPLFHRNCFNVWGGLGLTLQKLVFFTIKEEILEARKVDASISINGSDLDPLNELGFGEVVEARHYRLNLYKNSDPNLVIPLLPISPKFIFRNWKLRYL